MNENHAQRWNPEDCSTPLLVSFFFVQLNRTRCRRTSISDEWTGSTGVGFFLFQRCSVFLYTEWERENSHNAKDVRTQALGTQDPRRMLQWPFATSVARSLEQQAAGERSETGGERNPSEREPMPDGLATAVVMLSTRFRNTQINWQQQQQQFLSSRCVCVYARVKEGVARDRRRRGQTGHSQVERCVLCRVLANVVVALLRRYLTLRLTHCRTSFISALVPARSSGALMGRRCLISAPSGPYSIPIHHRSHQGGKKRPPTV